MPVGSSVCRVEELVALVGEGRGEADARSGEAGVAEVLAGRASPALAAVCCAKEAAVVGEEPGARGGEAEARERGSDRCGHRTPCIAVVGRAVEAGRAGTPVWASRCCDRPHVRASENELSDRALAQAA